MVYKENYFSAANLVKRSAMQICYLRNKRISIYNRNIARGVVFQKKAAEELEHYGESCEEQRSSLNINDITIFASHDIVTDNFLMEVKTYDPTLSEGDWFMHYSQLQTAFYKSIVMASDGNTFTPKFRLKEGYNKKFVRVDTDIPYLLLFGDRLFKVEVKDRDAILDYFSNKASKTYDYTEAKEYDKEHKHKEYDECKKFFKATRLTAKSMALYGIDKEFINKIKAHEKEIANDND